MSQILLFTLITYIFSSCGEKEKAGKSPAPRPSPNLELQGSTASGGGHNHLRGWQLSQEIIATRLFADNPEEPFEITKYISYDLRELLGFQAGNGLESSFRNGSPNGVNMLLWYLVYKNLSQDIVQYCNPEIRKYAAKINQRTADTIQPLCDAEDPTQLEVEVLYQFWLTLTAHDAPISEFNAWFQYFSAGDYEPSSPQNTISDMIVAAFYNPFVMLKR